MEKPFNGEIHSGLIGVPFKAQAKSYNKLFTDADFIQKVEFYYTQVDYPEVSDWTMACIDNNGFDEDYKYTKSWTNSIDDYMVWVCAITVDDGKCDSIPDETCVQWIKIDSTRPTVTNAEP